MFQMSVYLMTRVSFSDNHISHDPLLTPVALNVYHLHCPTFWTILTIVYIHAHIQWRSEISLFQTAVAYTHSMIFIYDAMQSSRRSKKYFTAKTYIFLSTSNLRPNRRERSVSTKNWQGIGEYPVRNVRFTDRVSPRGETHSLQGIRRYPVNFCKTIT